MPNADDLALLMQAKGIFSEAFELGGEKSEAQTALEQWNVSQTNLRDDDTEADVSRKAGGERLCRDSERGTMRSSVGGRGASGQPEDVPLLDASYITMSNISKESPERPKVDSRRGEGKSSQRTILLFVWSGSIFVQPVAVGILLGRNSASTTSRGSLMRLYSEIRRREGGV